MAINLQGEVLVFNKAAADILALKQEDVLNQPFALSFFEYEENDDFNQVFLNVFMQQTLSDKLVVKYYTGQEEKLLFMKCRLLYEHKQGVDEKVGIMVVFSDVSNLTEIKKVLQTTEQIENYNADDLLLQSKEEVHRPLITLQQVSKNYMMGEILVTALQETSVEIYTGELLVILGPSGSGKSTMLNLIGGMDQPSSGSIIYNGTDLSSASDTVLTEYRRREVGFVFQFYNLIPDLTASENVLLAAELADNPLSLGAVFCEVGLEHRQDHFPSQLSGGEQQRVSIARAIIKQPKILLCDEPTGALDSKSGKIVLELLENIAHKMESTVIIVTHNNAIAAVADRIFKMKNGQLVETYRNPYPIPAKRIEL
ncbi:MAG: putative ATPase, type [Firmicutes bacterium]|nr:putative ATPase, type [Bacillota bacterium]